MSALKVEGLTDKSIKAAVKAALANDKRISREEAHSILAAALDKKGITKAERQDLRVIFSQSQTIPADVKAEVIGWLSRCEKLASRLRYASVSKNYGSVPEGWKGSEYDPNRQGSESGGSCGVKISIALKVAGMSFAGFKWKFRWKNDLPVNAIEIANFLDTKLGPGEPVNRKSPYMDIRQGILFIAGPWSKNGRPVGHITLWNGKNCEDGTKYDSDVGAEACKFWELRPDWLKS